MLSSANTNSIGLSTPDYAILLVYLCVVICLGLVFGRGKKDTDSYLLGGRKLPWWAVGASFYVSVTSTLSLVGVPGEAYENGLTFVLFSLFSPVFAILTFFVFIRFFFQAKVFTPFSYLANRFDTRVRGVAAGIVSLTRMFYLGLVLYSSAKVFEGAAGWEVIETIALVGIIAIFYTAIGGISAVVWVDVVQFFIMVGGLSILAVKLATTVPDGLVGIFSYAASNDHLITKPGEDFYSFSPYVRLTLWLVVMQSLVTWMFFHSSDQIAIQRLLSTSSYQQAKRSMFMVVCIDLPMTLAMFFIGLALWVYYQQQDANSIPKDADLALFRFVTGQLPSPLPGLIIAAMLAAVFSTLDSGINALSTIFTKDFYLPLVHPDASEVAQVRFARWMTVLTGLVAIGTAVTIAHIAESADNKILESAFIWLSPQSIVPGVFVLAVFSRRATAAHALIALTSGAVAVVGMATWYFFGRFGASETISPFYIGATGLVTTVLAGFLAASFSKSDAHMNYDAIG